jgi:hypothetical protein
MRASRAANDIVPHADRATKTSAPIRSIDAVQPDQLIGDDDSVAVDDLGAASQAIGRPAERQNGDETSER